jgi:predicted transcriptional regulator
MGRGLSPLQKDILSVLTAKHGWTLPRDIIARLELPATNATRASVSRALHRLCERGLVVRAFAGRVCQGHSYLYMAGRPAPGAASHIVVAAASQ